MRKLILITATAVLGMSTAAFSQTTPDTSVSTGAAIPTGWNEQIRDAFFVDADQGKFRSGAEIQENWSSLGGANQSLVRDDCNTIMADNSALTDPNATRTDPAAAGNTGDAPADANAADVDPGRLASNRIAPGGTLEGTTSGNMDTEAGDETASTTTSGNSGAAEQAAGAQSTANANTATGADATTTGGNPEDLSSMNGLCAVIQGM